MKTLQDEWRLFRDKCYPQGMTPDQNRQLHQAFFAGAFVATSLTLPSSPETLHRLHREAAEVCGVRANMNLEA